MLRDKPYAPNRCNANFVYLNIYIKDGCPNFINIGLKVMRKLLNKINSFLNALPFNKIRAGLTPPFLKKGLPFGQIFLACFAGRKNLG